ncbi:hypothetical protein ILUMI_06408 [Ignelater luminosus]|uniref:Uncharacterized protein n=1 Tax=Ignelater luminosus TaxID=2038154 RepID=A0A8K0DAR5_IGNLU|nr:hypothetical protein ILUMI_06408 [Ignelater luminosus]
MQDDLLQPLLTVEESMLFAADLKLNRELSKKDKLIAIKEILEMLRLTTAKDTLTEKLSGGERKRVSIALELLNNPPIIFLDEPTTGLDDLSSSQCISLLKILAEGGRTVICSIHAPSARIFSKFDHTYIVSAGQCMYQGYGQDIIPFMSNIGLTCPTHYNPADFIIEVSTGDYGVEFLEKMSTVMDNGKNTSFCKDVKCQFEEIQLPNQTTNTQMCTITYAPTTTTERPVLPYNCDCSVWYQFGVLLRRLWIQTYRDTNYMILKIIVHAMLGVLIGGFYLNMGQDGSKTLFNFGFCYTCMIAFLYLPLMPTLLHFPTEIQLIKREYFNRWYRLTAYYLAMSLITLPILATLAVFYVSIAYVMSDQPIEFQRIAMFVLICILTSFISDSFGLLIASVVDIVNAMFIAPVASVPLILLAVYGMGQANSIPLLIKIAMHFSYLRYGMEGLTIAIYGNGRTVLPCPDEEDLCPFRDPKFFITFIGMGNAIFWLDVLALAICFIIFRFTSFYLLRQRLRPNKTFAALQVIGRIVKSHFSITR